MDGSARRLASRNVEFREVQNWRRQREPSAAFLDRIRAEQSESDTRLLSVGFTFEFEVRSASHGDGQCLKVCDLIGGRDYSTHPDSQEVDARARSVRQGAAD